MGNFTLKVTYQKIGEEPIKLYNSAEYLGDKIIIDGIEQDIVETIDVENAVVEFSCDNDVHENTFKDCINIVDIVFDGENGSVRSNAFEGCNNLSSVTLGSVDELESKSFYTEATNVKVVIGSDKVPYLGDKVFGDGWDYMVNEALIDEYTIALEQYNPNSITSDKGKYIQFVDKKVEKLCADAFGDGIGTTYAMAEAVTALGDTFKENQEITQFMELEYFTSLSAIEEGTFFRCNNLKSVAIPTSVTVIETSAFEDCTSLEDVIFVPQSKVERLGISAFEGCISLSCIELPQSLKEIEIKAFNDCIGLSTIKIPSGVETIGVSVFEGCSAMTFVNMIDNMNFDGIIPIKAFDDCRSLKQIKLPQNTKVLASCAFQGCTSLDCVDLPSQVEVLGVNSFNNCIKLKAVIIPKNIRVLSPTTFMNCVELESVVINRKTPFDATSAFDIGTKPKVYVPIGTLSKYVAFNEYWKKLNDENRLFEQ